MGVFTIVNNRGLRYLSTGCCCSLVIAFSLHRPDAATTLDQETIVIHSISRYATILAACAGVTLAASASIAHADVTLSVLYATPGNFSAVQDEIARRFMAEHPDIKIEFRTPAQDYEVGIQQILRSALTNDLPDIAYIGLNQLRVLVDRELAFPLDGFAEKDKGFAALGYMPSMLSLGQSGGTSYALPFAVSTPVLYVNEDLVKAAGGSLTEFPKTWEGVTTLAAKIHALPEHPQGFYFQWDASGNWLYQALVNSRGGHLAKKNGCELAFDSDAGRWALDALEMFKTNGMADFTWQQSRQAFDAGTLGIVAGSTSYVAQATRLAAGKFSFKTMPFPDVVSGGTVPAGGTSVAILAKNEEKRRAAWEYLKFATGPTGQTLMATYTGYMPSNRMAVEDPNLLGSYLKENPNQMTSITQMPFVGPWESWAGPNGLKIIDAMREDVQSVVRGKLSAKEAMTSMTGKVRKLLPDDCAGSQ
jgi:multiple sugar transport system substrate-binding protein